MSVPIENNLVPGGDTIRLKGSRPARGGPGAFSDTKRKEAIVEASCPIDVDAN